MFSKWQPLSIPFTGRLDTKTDEKAVQPTDLVTLENGIFEENGSIIKRFGYDRVQDYLITTPEIVTTFKDELLTVDIDTLYSYRDDSWDNKGSFEHIGLTEERLAQEPYDQQICDQAQTEVLRGFVWFDSRGVSYSIQDLATGQWLVQGALVDASGTRPRIIAIENQLVIIYGDAGATNIDYAVINNNAPTTTVTGTLISDMHANAEYDIVVGTSYYFIAYYSTDTGNRVRCARIQGNTVDITADSAGSAVPTGINLAVNDDFCIVTYRQATNAMESVEIQAPEGAFTFIADTTVVTASGTVTEQSVTLVTSGSDTVAVLYYVVSGDLQCLQYLADGSDGETALCLKDTQIAGQAFTVNNRAYVVGTHTSALRLQNANYIVHAPTYAGSGSTVAPGEIVAQFALGIAEDEGAAFTQHFPSTIVDGTTVRLCTPTKTRLKLPTDPGHTATEIAFGDRGLTSWSFEFNTSDYNAVEVQESLYFSGAMSWLYDGVNIGEAQPLMYPEPAITVGGTAHSFVATNNAGGDVDAGTYGYKIVYERRTQYNERMRSFALAFSVAMGGTTTGRIIFTLPPLYFTRYDDWYIVIYRTVDGGSTYYRVTSTDPTDTGANGWINNDKTVDSISWEDHLDDTDITANELEPTTGGVLANISIPATKFWAKAKRRAYAAGGTLNPDRVFFSKLAVPGSTVEFNDQLFIDVNNVGGPVTALAALNDQLVIFKRDKIFTVNGDGPNNLGQGGFQEPIAISTDSGCTNSQAVVEMPLGVMYKSAKGIYLLDEGGQTGYIGADVESYNNLTCVGAELLADQNAVLFLHSNGVALYYDYNFNKWSVFTNHTGIASTIWQNKYVYLNSVGDTLISNENHYRDGNVPYAVKLRTAPIRIDGLQGWWKCKYVYLLGEYFTPHQLRMDVYYNREKFARDSVTWQPTDFIDTSAWGDEATWGADEVWGGDTGQDYQVSRRCHPQKCQSISFEITEIPDSVQNGKAFQLTELALEWAPMSGLGRLDSARRK